MGREKILIAMSGGVDSAVAAQMICERGAECAGITMTLAGDNQKDIADAKAICEKLGIPHYTLDLREKFRESVINEFISAYEAGLTPNPCFICNKRIKFGALLDHASENGFDKIATGHYASVRAVRGRILLEKGADLNKDQSYFLSGLSQNQLSRVVFPLGDMTKEEVKEIALERGFSSAQRRESQDVCFVPDGDYVSVIKAFTRKKYPDGNFVTVDGKILGRHKGMINYTVGQRKGLGLALPAPMYVCEKRMSDNSVVLCTDAELFTREMTVKDINWISCEDAFEPFFAKVRIRYRHEEQPAVVIPIAPGRATVRFDQPQRAITPGQVAVIYGGNIVIGGGTIEGIIK